MLLRKLKAKKQKMFSSALAIVELIGVGGLNKTKNMNMQKIITLPQQNHSNHIFQIFGYRLPSNRHLLGLANFHPLEKWTWYCCFLFKSKLKNMENLTFIWKFSVGIFFSYMINIAFDSRWETFIIVKVLSRMLEPTIPTIKSIIAIKRGLKIKFLEIENICRKIFREKF